MGLGWLPALYASMTPPDRALASASAIWDRALLPVHRNNTLTAPGAAPSGEGRGETKTRVERPAGGRQQATDTG